MKNAIAKASKIALVLIALAVVAQAVTADDYLTCRNNAGDIIHVAAPSLCPPGFWQI